MLIDIDGTTYDQTPIEGCPDQYRLTRLEQPQATPRYYDDLQSELEADNAYYAELDEELPRSGNPISSAFMFLLGCILIGIVTLFLVTVFFMQEY